MANDVYGCLINLHTNEEIDFDGDRVVLAVTKIKALGGTVYGVDWEYAGDLTAEDSDASIYVADSINGGVSFGGTTAVADFLEKYA